MKTVAAMKKWSAWVGVAALIACASGCRTKVGAYEPCAPGDCDATTDGCVEVQVDYGDRRESGSVCSSECSATDSTCPIDSRGVEGACVSFGEDAAGARYYTCFERCTSDADCAPAYGCVDRLPDGAGGEYLLPEPICLPR